MTSFKESEIIAEHQNKQTAEKTIETTKQDSRVKDIQKKDQEQADKEITVPKTSPEVIIGYLKHYFDLKEVDEVAKHKIEEIYKWANGKTKDITPEGILDTLDLLGEQLGIMRLGDNKFDTIYQYAKLNRVKQEADNELKQMRSKWEIFSQA